MSNTVADKQREVGRRLTLTQVSLWHPAIQHGTFLWHYRRRSWTRKEEMEVKNVGVEESAAVFRRIIGARLTSVEFVLDHLALGFDGKGALTSLVWPEVS